MKRDTIYKLIIVVLLVLNLLQLGKFIWMPKFSRPRKMDLFANKAVTIMQLDSNQKQTFLQFVEKHKEQRRQLHERQIELARQYFKYPSDSLLILITEIETKKISITQEHFSDIKNMLKIEQIPLFDKFKEEALKGILQGGKPMGEPDRRNNNPLMPPPPPDERRNK